MNIRIIIYVGELVKRGRILSSTCADPESFVRGGPTLTVFFFQIMRERGSKYHLELVIMGPPAKRHLNGVSLAGR